MSGISKSQVSRMCAEIDEKVKAFLSRSIEGDWPYMWIDAPTFAAIIAVCVNSDGRREILDIGF